MNIKPRLISMGIGVLTTTLVMGNSLQGSYSQLGQPELKQNSEAGKLSLVANGEDFVRQGFVTKDNWRIDFEHIYVTLAEVKAYQTNPPFDADADTQVNSTETLVLLDSPKTIDLAAGDADADPILVTQVEAPPGFYNAIAWKVVPTNTADFENATIILQGTATKDSQTINFNIAVTQPLEYTCGEFIGDERKGFVQPGAGAELETTFHFDHVFGDGEAGADDPINTGALGFEPLAALATNNQLVIDETTLQSKLSPEDYQTFSKAIANLGHVGEGHCQDNYL